MPQTSPRQRKTVGRVMHEFKHGERGRSTGSKGGKVTSRKQAIAIALHESGTSKYESPERNAENEAKTEAKEARGETAQQETEGKARVGAKGRRESSPAMGGVNATKPVRPRRKAARRKTARKASPGKTAPSRKTSSASRKAAPKRRTKSVARTKKAKRTR